MNNITNIAAVFLHTVANKKTMDQQPEVVAVPEREHLTTIEETGTCHAKLKNKKRKAAKEVGTAA